MSQSPAWSMVYPVAHGDLMTVKVTGVNPDFLYQLGDVVFLPGGGHGRIQAIDWQERYLWVDPAWQAALGSVWRPAPAEPSLPLVRKEGL